MKPTCSRPNTRETERQMREKRDEIYTENANKTHSKGIPDNIYGNNNTYQYSKQKETRRNWARNEK